ncbi:MAG: hypothetical protein Q7T86_03225 [Hyphomicrobiaceae bacterium]|nr:hypothetical protein [Hyphomicrobiaceae bacterium]
MTPLSLDGVPLGMRLSVADHIARSYVQGEKLYEVKGGKPDEREWQPVVGQFHERFHTHPWVREAISEGWDRDLRAHMVGAAKRILIEGKSLKGIIAGDLMPKDREAIEHWRQQAARAKSAEEWRDKVIEQHGSVDAYLSKTYGGRATTFKKITPDKNFWNARYGRQG